MKSQVLGRSLMLVLVGLAPVALSQEPAPIARATLGDTDEVSTEQLQQILADGTTLVIDARPAMEFAISHIPGARNVAPKPGVAKSMYVSDVAEIGRLAGGNRSAPLVLYCNGPFCGKSTRLAKELQEAGYTNVRRYQLGIPVWRALGGITQIEPEGVRYVLARDATAVLIDVREPAEFEAGSMRGAKNIPRSLVREGKDVGEVKKAKDDGRLPMEDHNTRIIVLGNNVEDARFVAVALTHEAFQNVSYFAGSLEEARADTTPVE